MRSLIALVGSVSLLCAQDQAPVAAPPARPLWNGVDLQGWHGQRHESPYKLMAMAAADRAKLQAEDDATMRQHWRVLGNELVNDGEGAYLTTDAEFGDAEFWLEYRTVAQADSGIYLRGSPQVQIWDTTEAGGKWKIGADKGSGGLWNNQTHPRFPPVLADRPFGEWNALYIRQIGSRTWVRLNDKTTVDGAIMENYWDRKLPLPARGPVQLQTHGGEIRFRELRVREIGTAEANLALRAHDAAGFTPILDSVDQLAGAKDICELVDGVLHVRPGKTGTVHTKERYGNFVVRFQFQVPPGGNNGLAIRYSGEGDAAYNGLEIQVLDDSHAKYATLKPWQYHGSIYGLVASQRGYQRRVGEWNFQQVTVNGSRITVELNGAVIVDADCQGLTSNLEKHVGKDRTEGFFGFACHGDAVAFRDIQIKPL